MTLFSLSTPFYFIPHFSKFGRTGTFCVLSAWGLSHEEWKLQINKVWYTKRSIGLKILIFSHFSIFLIIFAFLQILVIWLKLFKIPFSKKPAITYLYTSYIWLYSNQFWKRSVILKSFPSPCEDYLILSSDNLFFQFLSLNELFNDHHSKNTH